MIGILNLLVGQLCANLGIIGLAPRALEEDEEDEGVHVLEGVD